MERKTYFFVNKKKQKNFGLSNWRGPIQTALTKGRSVIGMRDRCYTGAKRSKSLFGSFSSEKERLSSLNIHQMRDIRC
jgi:hypothetical protein